MVYSDKGYIPIETLNRGQRIWDGQEWVNFQDVVPVGEKNVIQIGDLWLTPDHRLLTKQGWRTAAEIVLSGDTRHLKLGSSSQGGQLLLQNSTLKLNDVSLSAVNAALKKIEESTNCGAGLRERVGAVVKASKENLEADPVNTLISSLILDYENVGVYVGITFVDAVRTQITKTTKGMVIVGFEYPSNHVERSWNILLHWMGGDNGGLPWIELTMPKGTLKEIFDSLLKEKTITTKVKTCWDIIGASNNKFQVEGMKSGGASAPSQCQCHSLSLSAGVTISKSLLQLEIEVEDFFHAGYPGTELFNELLRYHFSAFVCEPACTRARASG